MISLFLAPAAFGATMLGGLVALRLKDRLHLILGFSAGAVVGVAFFDLLPEALRFTQSFRPAGTTMLFVAVGFLFYLLLDRVALLHAAGQDNGHAPEHSHVHAPRSGLGAVTLVAHSVFDGMAIGFAFQISNTVGAAVAIAVLTHDFSDGINTMNVVLKNGGTRSGGLRWLLADSLAPAVGIGAAFFVHLPAQAFGTVLALFGGSFLYLGASDLVPESHHAHPKFLTTVMTVLGAVLVYATNAVMN
jgi:ZIP family zinc transporter